MSDLWLEIIGEMEGRRQKGLETYGVPVTPNATVNWLRHSLEEKLDDAVYMLAAEKVMLRMQRRVAELEAALREAVRWVGPTTQDLVRVYSDLEGLEVDARERIRAAEETKGRLLKVLEGQV